MLFCTFESSSAGRLRCRRCGFEDRFGCRPEQVRRPCDVLDPRAAARRQQAPCIYLGPELGQQACTTCRGRVRVKEFACRHPRHERTTLLRCRSCGDYEPHNPLPPAGENTATRASRRKPTLLLRFGHGLGDAVQLTTVLLHLRHFHPEWEIDVACKVGAHSLYGGLCRRVFILGREPHDYDLVRSLNWHEPDASYADSPSTKAEKCLREVFCLPPRLELCRYAIQPDAASLLAARSYLDEVMLAATRSRLPSRGETSAPQAGGPKPEAWPVVLLHYQGNSARRNKNLDERAVAALCQAVRALGGIVVILDWDNRSRLIDQSSIFCPAADHPLWKGTGTGDGAALAALASLATWCVGIDSGPGHIFGATPTPTTIVWTGHHPVHYYGLAENVLHLVPQRHVELIRGDRAAGREFFAQHYRYRTYRHLEWTLPALVHEYLAAGGAAGTGTLCSKNRAARLQAAGEQQRHERGMESGAGTTSPEVHSLEPGVERLEAAAALIVDGDCWVRREHHAADMVIVRDVYLEDCYGVASLPNAPQFVIDVGAHLGAFTRRVRERTAHAQVACIEANPTNLPALRANAGAFAHLFAAACHYEPGELALFSTVFPGSDNTGGSAVARVGSPTFDRLASDGRYRYAGRVEAVRLEAIAAGLSWPRIDLLKLDCEGSEFEILEHCDLSLLRWIVGEQHDEARFAELMARRFAGWNVRILRAGTPGLFWLWRA